jgi:hypothetical protein
MMLLPWLGKLADMARFNARAVLHKKRPQPFGRRGRQPQGLLPVWLVGWSRKLRIDSRRQSWFLQVMPFFPNQIG